MSSPANPNVGIGAEQVPPTTLCVILAAGGGTRFRGPDHKLNALLDDRSVASHAIDAAITSGVGDVIIITGDAPLDLDPQTPATTVRNPDWASGQASSLQTAIRIGRERGADALVVGLADQPFITPTTWRNVAASTSPIAVATYGGHRRNPVRLHRSVWDLLPVTGDSGARDLIRLQAALVQEIPSPGSAADIDTKEDLQQWQRRSSTSSR